MILDEHRDSPVEVRPPVTDSQGRQRRDAAVRPSEADQVHRIILHRIEASGPVVGQVVLAEPELPPEPPEQRLIEEHEPGDRREGPGAGVAALDVRPLVRQAEPQFPRITLVAERLGQHDHRPGPRKGKRQLDRAALQQSNLLPRWPADLAEDLMKLGRDRPRRTTDPPEQELS